MTAAETVIEHLEQSAGIGEPDKLVMCHYSVFVALVLFTPIYFIYNILFVNLGPDPLGCYSYLVEHGEATYE
jgi:hypothetical protein